MFCHLYMSSNRLHLVTLPTVLFAAVLAMGCSEEPAGETDDSKSDDFDNAGLGEDCNFDWECSNDESLTCNDDDICAAADLWEMAKDVNLHNVPFGPATPIPEEYTRPDGIDPVSLSTPEWWQRWSGGFTQSFSWSEGTDFGKRCGVASAIRLQSIMEHVAEDGSTPGKVAIDNLLESTGWSGTMYNWTEDISESTTGRGSFNTGSIWAWRTGAIKWINIVREDGSCDLPTLELVQQFSESCIAEATDGEIEGCSHSL